MADDDINDVIMQSGFLPPAPAQDTNAGPPTDLPAGEDLPMSMSTTIDLPQHNSSEPPSIPTDTVQSHPQSEVDMDIQPAADQQSGSLLTPVTASAGEAMPSLSTTPPGAPQDDDISDESSDDADLVEEELNDWRDIPEDKSLANEDEIRGISQPELTASDEDAFEKMQFPQEPLPEPCSVTAKGRLTWELNPYNGTADKPVLSTAVRSPTVKIGGYEWQVKLFPQGYEPDTDYISIFLECKDMVKPQQPKPLDTSSIPLQPLNPAAATRAVSVAAQYRIVLYNPDEPRVFVEKAGCHRFSAKSPDWGFIHFHGPYWEIGRRKRGQRQALYRNDKLAVKAYIQLVDDPSNCVFEHNTNANNWDSFDRAGLQPFNLAHGPKALFSAVVPWLLFKPFRKLLYNLEDAIRPLQSRPKKMVEAFQKVLFQLRTIQDPSPVASRRSIDLSPIMHAFHFYGVNVQPTVDVIALWELLQIRMQFELQDTPFANRISEMFGPITNRTNGYPRYRVPAIGIECVQDAIDQTLDLGDAQPPELLHLEFDRQIFDDKENWFVRNSSSFDMEDFVTIQTRSTGAVKYELFGFITHLDDLRQPNFGPLLRPQGSGSPLWYNVGTSGKDDGLVYCLFPEDAWGSVGTESKIASGDSIMAYVALYVRDDISVQVFDTENEPDWVVPKHLIEEDERRKRPFFPIGSAPPPPSFNFTEQVDILAATQPKSLRAAKPEAVAAPKKPDYPGHEVEIQVFNSALFQDHDGPGFVDLYEPRVQETRYTFNINSKADASSVAEQIASHEGVNPEDIRFWIVDPNRGNHLKPQLRSSGHPVISCAASQDSVREFTAGRRSGTGGGRILWYHINHGSTAEPISQQPKDGEDTLMSDPEDDSETFNFGSGTTQAASFGSGAPRSSNIEVDAPVPPPPTIETETKSVKVKTPEFYFFLKHFDPEQQRLSTINSFVVKRNAPFKSTITRMLRDFGIKDSSTLELFIEDNLRITVPLSRNSGSFFDLHLDNGAILVAQTTMVKDDTPLAAKIDETGGCRTLSEYLESLSRDRALPGRNTGTFTLDYFGREFYQGEVVAHRPHGRGVKRDFSGNVYEGSFRRGQRHGHGTLVVGGTGDRYVGDFVADKKHGKGEFLEALTGNRYVGNFVEDRKAGQGITYWVDAARDERTCRVCFGDPADAAFYECGHIVACTPCARQLFDMGQACPICRRDIRGVVKLYWSSG
jgi:hypothetical protein